MANCIDISKYNGKIDFRKVKESGITDVIIRTVVKGNKIDGNATDYFKDAIAVGLNVAAYKYCYALTCDEAIVEAMETVKYLRSIGVVCKIWWDMEYQKQPALGRQNVTDLVKAAADVVKDAGYEFGVYCNLSWYKSVLFTEQLPYDFWIARYPLNDDGKIHESLRPSVGEVIWQYSSKGRVNGIDGFVDMNDMTAEEFYPLPMIKNCFESCGIPADFGSRKKIAMKNGLVGYTGTVEENMYLMALWTQGKLKR